MAYYEDEASLFKGRCDWCMNGQQCNIELTFTRKLTSYGTHFEAVGIAYIWLWICTAYIPSVNQRYTKPAYSEIELEGS